MLLRNLSYSLHQAIATFRLQDRWYITWGVCALVLRRLDDVIRERDKIYAVVSGIAIRWTN